MNDGWLEFLENLPSTAHEVIFSFVYGAGGLFFEELSEEEEEEEERAEENDDEEKEPKNEQKDEAHE
jgi:hypothetical protein